MANFNFDQAEGLRRMLAGPKPRIVTFLSVLPDEEKSAMLVNLGASLVQAGSDVLLVDARATTSGVAARLGGSGGASLLDVARQRRAPDEVIRSMPQGFGLVTLARGMTPSETQNPDEYQRLASAFGALATQAGVVLVDGELDAQDSFPIAALAGGEIVVQVSTSQASITSAYTLIKRLNARLGRRPFGVLVTGADEAAAQRVYQNLAQTASRYLAIQLNSMGSVPADEYLNRAAHLGRPVVEAFPLAGASVAFRRLAEQFSLS